MSTWQSLPLNPDPDAVTLQVLADLAAALGPAWVEHESALEVALAETFGTQVAATNARTVFDADAAMAAIAETVDGLAPITGAPATLPMRLTVTGPGAVVPAGLSVVARTDDGIDVPFALPAATAATSTTVDVVVVATEVGSFANGVPPGPVELVTASSVVVDAEATAPSSGGVAPETLSDYLGRWKASRQLLRPGGVRAEDLALLARSTPGVHRALTLDLYDAQTGATDAEKTVSLFPVDADGASLTAAQKTALRAAVEAVREVNFIVRVADPTHTAVDVYVEVVADTGAAPAAVEAAVRASVAGYLSPATHGATAADPRAWVPRPVVRYLDVVRAVGNAPGVAALVDVTLDGDTVDVTLPGVAALPSPTTGTNPSVITVVVT